MAVATFMESSLVTWVRTFSAGEVVEFNDLIDAVYLHDVFTQIDEKGQESKINRMAKDSNAKIQNWNTLIKDILAFYQDVLQQMVVLELPDISSIVKEPTKDGSLKDFQRVLLLLLGCAIQSPGKESFIQNITRLDIHTQEAIMEYIKQITDGQSVVINADSRLANLGRSSRDNELFITMKSLVKEREKYSQRITQLIQERDYHKTEADTKRGPLTPPATLENHHLMREMTKFKTKASSLTDEVEEKGRQLGDIKEELTSLKQERLRLKQENMMLSKDAKATRSYRDELDNLKEQAMKAEKLERELSKYKEKMNELDFFKSRVEELREDNSLLSDGKAKAEDQNQTTSKRLESLLGDLDLLQMKVEEANQEKEHLNKKLQEVMEENANLEMEKNCLREGGMRRYQSTSRFLTSSQVSLPGLAGANSNGNPISEELNETMLSKASRLEMENEELKRELEESQGVLMDTERKLQQTLATSQMEYKHKSDQLQLETSALRHKLSQELSNEYRVKFEEKMKHQEEQVRRLLRDHQETLMSLKNREKELVHRLGEMERKEKQQLTRQESADQKDMALKEEVAELKKSAELAKTEKESAKKELETAHRKAIQAHKFAENMQKERDSANQMMTHIQMTTKTQIDELQDQLSQLKKTNEQLQENYNQLSNQNGYDSGIDESRHSPKSNGTMTIPSPQVSRSPKMTGRPQSMFVNPKDVMIHHSQPHGFKTPQSGKSRGPMHTPSPNKPMPQQFNRHNPLRITITPMRHPQNFSRDHRLRQSMPDKKFMYRPPERRPQQHPKQPTSRNSSIQETPTSSAVNTPSQSGQTTPTGSIGSDTIPISRSRKTSHNADMNDCSTPLSSRNAPNFSLDESLSSINSTSTANGDSKVDSKGDSKDEKINRILRTLKITSTETITTKLKSFTKSEKTKVFIDKIIELQDKNQNLNQETSDLRKKLGSFRFSEDRVDRLEKKILELEAENQKLRKILEMYNYNGNPNDSRMYHYYSNV